MLEYGSEKLPRKSKREREISVNAPDYIPKRESILKDTTGTEALGVFHLSNTLGRNTRPVGEESPPIIEVSALPPLGNI